MSIRFCKGLATLMIAFALPAEAAVPLWDGVFRPAKIAQPNRERRQAPTAEDQDGDAIPDEFENKLLAMLEPDFHVNNSTNQRPVSVSQFLSRSWVLNRFNQRLGKSFTARQAIDSFEQPSNLFERLDLFDASDFDPMTQRQDARVYGRVAHSDYLGNQMFIVQYYLLFLRNIAQAAVTDAGDHDGDVIAVDFTVMAPSIDDVTVTQVILHNHGRQFFVNPKDMTLSGDHHPQIYLEDGTNEPWGNRGAFGVYGWPLSLRANRIFRGGFLNIGGESDVVHDHYGKGPIYRPQIVNLGECHQNSGQIFWLGIKSDDKVANEEAEFLARYDGTWGNTREEDFGFKSESPEGPCRNGKMWLRDFEFGDLNAAKEWAEALARNANKPTGGGRGGKM